MKKYVSNRLIKHNTITLILGYLLVYSNICFADFTTVNNDTANLENIFCQGSKEYYNSFVSGFSFSKCYSCPKEVIFPKEKLKNITLPEFFPSDDIEYYLDNFFRGTPKLNSATYKRMDTQKNFCFTFENGQLASISEKVFFQEHPIQGIVYENEDVKTAKENTQDYDSKNFKRYYKNGQLKEKCEPVNEKKEVYCESYYNDGQLRAKE